MNRSELRKIIKEEIKLLLEKDISRYALDYKNIYALKISMDDVEELENIVNRAHKKHGDSGTCILGARSGLFGNGKKIIGYWTQGCMAPESAFEEAKKYLEKEYPKIKLVIKYGAMD